MQLRSKRVHILVMRCRAGLWPPESTILTFVKPEVAILGIVYLCLSVGFYCSQRPGWLCMMSSVATPKRLRMDGDGIHSECLMNVAAFRHAHGILVKRGSELLSLLEDIAGSLPGFEMTIAFRSLLE